MGLKGKAAGKTLVGVGRRLAELCGHQIAKSLHESDRCIRYGYGFSSPVGCSRVFICFAQPEIDALLIGAKGFDGPLTPTPNQPATAATPCVRGGSFIFPALSIFHWFKGPVPRSRAWLIGNVGLPDRFSRRGLRKWACVFDWFSVGKIEVEIVRG